MWKRVFHMQTAWEARESGREQGSQARGIRAQLNTARHWQRLESCSLPCPWVSSEPPATPASHSQNTASGLALSG